MTVDKQTGLGATITIDDSAGTPVDVSVDLTNWSMATPKGVIEVTGVSQLGMARLLGLADASATFNTTFDTGATQSHSVFKSISNTNVARTVATVLASQTLSMEMLLTDYQIQRDDSAKITGTVPGVLSDGTPPAWS